MDHYVHMVMVIGAILRGTRQPPGASMSGNVEQAKPWTYKGELLFQVEGHGVLLGCVDGGSCLRMGGSERARG